MKKKRQKKDCNYTCIDQLSDICLKFVTGASYAFKTIFQIRVRPANLNHKSNQNRKSSITSKYNEPILSQINGLPSTYFNHNIHKNTKDKLLVIIFYNFFRLITSKYFIEFIHFTFPPNIQLKIESFYFYVILNIIFQICSY